MKIVNTSDFSFTPTEYTYNIGAVKKGTSKTVSLTIEGAEHKDIKAGCGACTKAVAKQNGENIDINITYTALSRGGFNKTVTETFTNGTTLTIKLKGTDV